MYDSYRMNGAEWRRTVRGWQTKTDYTRKGILVIERMLMIGN